MWWVFCYTCKYAGNCRLFEFVLQEYTKQLVGGFFYGDLSHLQYQNNAHPYVYRALQTVCCAWGVHTITRMFRPLFPVRPGK